MARVKGGVHAKKKHKAVLVRAKGHYGNRSRTFTKRELVILIKPTVIHGERDWAEDIAAARERVSGYAAPREDATARK